MFSGPGSIEALEGAQARLAQLQGLTGTETRNELIDMFGPKGFVSDVNDPRHPQHNPGGGGGINNIYPYTEMASAPIQEEEIEVADVADVGLGSGHFRLPEQYRLAEGGRIPAAYGGIMDTYTGRRKYGLGSVFKKITSALKKLLKQLRNLLQVHLEN